MPERSKGRNPYASPVQRNNVSHGEAPNPSHEFLFSGYGAYTVRQAPDSSNPEYTTGFSPELRAGGSPDGSALPDDVRIGKRTPPGPGKAGTYNERRWESVRDSEFLHRHSVEQHSEGWKVQQQRVPPPRVPLWEQERAPVRPTADNSPSGYLFTRPWHIPRNITEAVGPHATTHFSLAAHRRTFEIMGMKPQGRLGVNTYRASPRPWDENLFIPPPAGQTPNGIAGNRSHRL